MGYGAVATFLYWVAVAFMVVGGIAASQRSASPARKNEEVTGLLQQFANTMSTQVYLPLIYGRTRVGCNRVYAGTSGTDNSTLHIIATIGEGPIHGIAQVGGVDQVFLDGALWTDNGIGGSYFSYTFFDGSSSQTVCDLHNVIPEWDDPLRNTAYLYCVFVFNSDKFQSLPNITVEVEGLEVYDPATDTTDYSDNPALAARDYLTRSSRRGGMDFATTRINDTLINSAAAYCTSKGWTISAAIMENDFCADIFTRYILNTFRGALVQTPSEFKLKYMDWDAESTVMDIDEKDIVESSGKSSLKITQPDVFQTPNSIKLKFPNADKNYNYDEYTLSDEIAVAADGSFIETSMDMLGVSSKANIMKMANFYLEKLRANKQAGFAMGWRGLALEPFDLIKLTSSRHGITDKVMRVMSPSATPDGIVSVQAVEELEEFYDDTTYSLPDYVYDVTFLPNPSTTVVGVGNVTQAEQLYSYRGRTQIRWKIDFDAPAAAVYPWWDYCDVYLRIVNSSGDSGYKFMTKSGDSYIVDPVEEGATYYCKLVSVSIWGTKQADADAYIVSKTILGKYAAPASLASMSAVVSGDGVAFYATQLTDPDIEGYEVRCGATWDSGAFIGFNETPNIRIFGVKPGSITFWGNTKGTNGLYGETPRSATVNVLPPIGYVTSGGTYHTWAWDYSTGDFSNTEQCDTDKLKCSHTGDDLVGGWTSPEIDLGSVVQARVWGDFVSALTGGGTTWADIFAARTWEDILLTTATRWMDILVPEYAGTVRAVIFWGNAPLTYDGYVDHFEFCAVDIEARYIQVYVQITDPSSTANIKLDELNMIAAERS